MRVAKRDGTLEKLMDLNKIVRAKCLCCDGLENVDTIPIATRTISGLYDGATTQELDELLDCYCSIFYGRGASVFLYGCSIARQLHRRRVEPKYLVVFPIR